jgi:hypothetical protein
MSILMKQALIAVSVLTYLSTPALSLEVAVDSNSTVLPWLVTNIQGDDAVAGVGPVKPTQAAVMYLVKGHGVTYPKDIGAAVLATDTGESLSQSQKDLVSTGQGIVLGTAATWSADRIYHYKGVEDAVTYLPNCSYVRLYSVSEEDAKKMIKAFVEAMEVEATAQVREAERKCEDYARNESLLQQKIEETQAAIQDIVRNPGIMISPEDISRLISTTEELKNSLSIDVAGLNARIEAMTMYIASKETSPEGKTRLQQMLIDQNIELAGVLAKLKAADEARDKAQGKYLLSMRLGELRKQSDELRAQLMKAQEQFREADIAYMKAQGEVIHPQIFQNKATIYPVKMEK